MKKYFVHTMGCQMNAHDSRRIEEVLREHGYVSASEVMEADLVVFNTCSVRDKAEHKLLSAVGRLRPLKELRPDMVIAIAGCMAQEHGASLLKTVRHADIVLGPDNIPDLPGLVAHVQEGGAPLSVTVFDEESPRFLKANPRPFEREVTSYVTVMKGCDERCSFCIVPYTRGSERYRSADDIVSEIAHLVNGGVREITLLGQTVNSWHDPSGAPASKESQFAALLRRIASDVPGLERLRYTSPHPRHVTPALIQAHEDLDVLPSHVHLPVQSGSDRVLRRMIRRYTRSQYIERAWALKQSRKGLTLSTDIIVGFPGETEEDFEETLSLVREVGFVAAFAFKYSPRPYTPALRLEDDVVEEVKSKRLEQLLELVAIQQSAHLESLVGTTQRVLVEGRGRDGSENYTGRNNGNVIVHFTTTEEVDLIGTVVEVEITRAHKHSVAGHASALSPSAVPHRRAPFRLPVVAAR